MAFQEIQWHTIDDADFDGVDKDIQEITDASGAPVFDNIVPLWTDA